MWPIYYFSTWKRIHAEEFCVNTFPMICFITKLIMWKSIKAKSFLVRQYRLQSVYSVILFILISDSDEAIKLNQSIWLIPINFLIISTTGIITSKHINTTCHINFFFFDNFHLLYYSFSFVGGATAASASSTAGTSWVGDQCGYFVSCEEVGEDDGVECFYFVISGCFQKSGDLVGCYLRLINEKAAMNRCVRFYISRICRLGYKII